MTVREADVVQEHPTEAQPSSGSAALSIDEHEVVLSAGVWWIEPNGDYVIRSIEFDVAAGGSTFRDALAEFIDNVWEFGVYLAELEDRAENEEAMFNQIADAFKIDRKDIMTVLNDWTPEQLKAHLEQFNKADLMPANYRRSS